jgi:pentatricopeptide repeat protein
LELIATVCGIDDVEKYFIDLLEREKNQQSYGALMNCYMREELVENVKGFLEKMKELDFVSNAAPYNNMMNISLKIGQQEKVPLIMQ